MKKPRPIRILSVADFHCGNRAGLTPEPLNPNTEAYYMDYVARRTLNEWVRAEIDKLRPIDICVCNGDLIDGKGPKSGGREQIEQDREKQAEMAIDFIKFIDAKEYHFAYGTAYHVGSEEDWETVIAHDFGAEVKDQVTLYQAGMVLKWRHHIGASQTPNGRATPMLRQQEWDILWSVRGEYDRADIMTFAHTHYFMHVANRFGDVFILPGLQGVGGSQLGARRMGGVVDFGFLHYDLAGKDNWTWKRHLLYQTKAVRAGTLPNAEAACPVPA